MMMKKEKNLNKWRHTVLMDWKTQPSKEISFSPNLYIGIMQFLSRSHHQDFWWIYTRLFQNLYGMTKKLE